jgi:hypothetical protein
MQTIPYYTRMISLIRIRLRRIVSCIFLKADASLRRRIVFDLQPVRIHVVRSKPPLLEEKTSMIDQLRTSSWLLLLLSAVFLEGCALTQPDSDYSGRSEPRAQRENMLQAAWRGRPYTSLLEVFGSPKMVMSVPGYRQLRTSVVVYGTLDKTTQCIDAFTIVQRTNGDLTVSDYFCR